MAKKPTVTTISSGYASNTQLNNNFEALRDGFDNTLSLDGSAPNAMNAALDLNNNDILNVDSIQINSLTDGTNTVDITDITTVAGVASEITIVANDLNGSDTIGTVATNISNVNAVGNNISNVVAAGSNTTNINIVATDLNGSDTIGTVASNISNVNAVGSNISNVNSVASNNTNINTVATNIADVNTAASNINQIVTAVNTYLDGQVYLGSQSSNPTQRPDGSALDTGDLYFNTSADELRVWTGTIWTSSTQSAGGTVLVDRLTGNGSTTAYSLSFTPSGDNFIQVYIDGVYQQKNSYTLSSNNLTFSEAPPLNSEIEVVGFQVIQTSIGTTDASLVNFSPAGVGSQDRTAESKLREFVSVKDFGAVGDGVTDDTAAIQAAFDSGSKNVFFPTGTYVISSGLDITSSMNVSCDENVVINGTAIPASVTLGEQHIVKATGSIGSSIALTSDITEEDTTITLTSTAGLAAGDYILVSSTGKFAAGWTGNNYQGWITTIESVDSGTQITVSTRAFSDLLVSDTAVVQKINHISVNWSGGKLLGRGLNGGHVGFPLAYCVDSSVEGLEIDGCEGSGVSFSYCFNCHATRLSVKNCLSTPALGNTGYGFVAVDATQYSSCSHSYFERCRHSVSGGGAYPARFIDILHNHSVDGGRGTRDFDCHEPCFFWKFDGNSTVGDNGGFIIRGQYVNITNNYIRNSGQIAIDIRGYGTLTDGITDFVVDGNVIDQARTGVQVTLNDSITPKNAVISNNTIRNTELEGVIVGSAENVTIIGNTIDTTTDDSGADGNGIRAGSTSRLIISNNMIGNTIDNGILTENNTDMLVANNIYYNITGVKWVDTGSTFVNTDNTSTGVLSQGNFTGATTFANKSLVVAAKNATAGSGTYGGSLAFARVNTNEPRAAIVSHQLTTNNEQVGITFWSHPTSVGTDPMEHMLTLSHVGNFYPEDDQARALGLAAHNWSKAYMAQLNIIDGITAPTTEAGHACIYVDSADGDLKVKFGDGTVKTIVTDT